jgi:hypothetical protein
LKFGKEAKEKPDRTADTVKIVKKDGPINRFESALPPVLPSLNELILEG